MKDKVASVMCSLKRGAGISEEEYVFLCEHLALLSDSDLAHILRTQRHKRLREEVREEAIARAVIQPPWLKILAVAAAICAVLQTLQAFWPLLKRLLP
ncbi:MAG: hypothetical protein Q7S40_34815 [Opitutaceae bacterium]|nr:hypothetical protein [Opitutaceae bacterium]